MQQVWHPKQADLESRCRKSVLPAGLSKKNTRKKCPFWEKKHNFSKIKKALFDIILFHKRVFCLPFLHKISPSNTFKNINYLFLFFNISNTYFTTPLMIIVSHNFKEMIFSSELTRKCNRMSYSMIPDLLLYGLFNIHSLRQTKYFLFLKLKILPTLVNKPLKWPIYAWILLYPKWHIMSDLWYCIHFISDLWYCIHFKQILHLILLNFCNMLGQDSWHTKWKGKI